MSPPTPPVERSGSGAPAVLADTAGHLDSTRRQIRWCREVTLDTHPANTASHSGLLVLGEEAATEFFTEERARLRKLFPRETIEETYGVDLLLAIRP
ncbi:hypothetical protein WBG99_14515 [Streptomyces sp. TG1A-60]|uniref:hypothetical protein n=1 Tax=Streptomyces sp. TG1A-60 TaxID=3129111 RepID=UPI0030CDF255